MSEAVEVRDNPAESRFDITVDGALAGSAYYQPAGSAYTFTHTEIDPAYGGRGLGSTLVKAALGAIRERGAGVLPDCPFVRKYVAGHPEYQDLVPATDRGRYGL
jgi:predicted GNAT family acetyltransferase